MQTAPLTPNNPHRPRRRKSAITPLRLMLLDLESKLGVDSPAIYTKLGMPAARYNTWRRGLVRRPKDTAIYEKFINAYGIDFYLSLGMGEIVVVDRELFRSCAQTDLAEDVKRISAADAVNTITPLHVIARRIQASLNVSKSFVAAKLGVSPSVYGGYLDGTIQQPRPGVYERCKTELGIDLYLSQGKGDVVIVNPDRYMACSYSDQPRPKPPNTEKPVFIWPFHEAVKHIETFLNIDPSFIYLKLGIGKIIYQGWKSGKRRILKEIICTKYRVEFGIDLFQSMIHGKIVIAGRDDK
ncbi:hypothetical protein ACTJJB_22600 [Chitinophaga sp. 22536]|uniref:hypothetical protein n=1 Tax=unclassified Chitinophaga TaxID=2619133 RepID=UPI003F84AE8E